MAAVSERCIVDNIDSAVALYSGYLDFHVDLHFALGFASLSRENLRLH